MRVAACELMRSDADARPVLVEERSIAGVAEQLFDLSLTGSTTAVATGSTSWRAMTGSFFEGADWSVAGGRRSGTASVGMATFNRPADCLAQLTALAGDPDVLAVLDRIIVVDQGTDLVSRAGGVRRRGATTR